MSVKSSVVVPPPAVLGIVGGVYDGQKIDFEFGDCTGVRDELRIIHNPDEMNYGEYYAWDY